MNLFVYFSYITQSFKIYIFIFLNAFKVFFDTSSFTHVLYQCMMFHNQVFWDLLASFCYRFLS